jgi:hypothetical protein
LIAGISFPLQLEQISSGMPISAICEWQEAHCRYKSQNQLQREMRELSAMGVKGLSAISSLQRALMDRKNPHIFA